MLKYFKIGRYGLAALVSIFCSAALRLVLLAQGWPATNSDEATMGLMARDIAYRGQLPIFFYGQNYMGAFEAYLAAVAFRLFGSSLFSLRVGLVLLFILFLVSTYLLTSLLYTKRWALAVVTMLGLGSSFVLARELSAIGGYPETLLFGSLAFLLAARLALGYEPGRSPGTQRYIGYTSWGLVVGLGLWSDLLIAPFALCSGLLLLICCWQEVRRVLVGLWALLGLVVGGLPLLLYNLTAAPGQDSLSVLWQIQHSGNGYIAAHFVQQIFGTLQVSIPMITGSPFCPVPERLESQAMTSLPCTLARASWGTAYLFIFLVALVLGIRAILRSYRQLDKSSPAARLAFVGDSTRLLLLASALLTLLLYAMGGSPVEWPGSRSRYLIGLLIAAPAILWPLWHALETGNNAHRITRINKWLSIGVLLFATIFLLMGTVLTFTELPATQSANQRQQALIDHLLQIGATHIYSDYWTCNRLAFVSNERIICGVVELDLQRSQNFNRDPAYYPVVSADAHACYLFSIHTHIPPMIQQARLTPEKYKRTLFDSYIIYQPRTSASSYTRSPV